MIERIDPRARHLVRNGKLSARRREKNRAAARCINENLAMTHGPATHGVRCLACYETHRRTA